MNSVPNVAVGSLSHHDSDTSVGFENFSFNVPAITEVDPGFDQASLPSSFHLSTDSILSIRSALKLATKLESGLLQEGESRMSEVAAEVATMLTSTNAPVNVIVAGCLFNALENNSSVDIEERQSLIRRKFGDEVVKLIEQVSMSREFHTVSTIQSSGAASLLCAVEHCSDPRRIQEEQLFAAAEAHNVDPRLYVNHELGSHFTSHVYPQKELSLMRDALKVSCDLFSAVTRSWGPHETMPLSLHTTEVGMLLIAAGAPSDIVIAGFLHDAFEGYVGGDVEALKIEIESRFGGNVLRLIEQQTEPEKSPSSGNWWERKQAVLDFLSEGDTQLATLVCAAKISTLSNGNKFLYMGCDVSEWSSGSLEDNLKVFRAYDAIFQEKGVPQPLLGQFEVELQRFASGQRKVLPPRVSSPHEAV